MIEKAKREDGQWVSLGMKVSGTRAPQSQSNAQRDSKKHRKRLVRFFEQHVRCWSECSMRFAWDNAKETILSAEENAHVDAAAPLDVCSATALQRLLFFPPFFFILLQQKMLAFLSLLLASFKFPLHLTLMTLAWFYFLTTRCRKIRSARGDWIEAQKKKTTQDEEKSRAHLPQLLRGARSTASKPPSINEDKTARTHTKKKGVKEKKNCGMVTVWLSLLAC